MSTGFCLLTEDTLIRRRVCVCVLTDLWMNGWIVNILADVFPALIYGLLSDTVNTQDYSASTD